MSKYTFSGRTLIDLLDGAVARFGNRPAVGLRQEDGSTSWWTYDELGRRSRLAAWRLRARGLRPGDRILTWSVSTPELAAIYFGAMRAGVILVPLDQRMAPAAVQRIAERSGSRHLVIGTGRDAPDPSEASLEHLPVTTTVDLCADPEAGMPPDWEAQVAGWSRPGLDDVYLLIYTSGTTGNPKGVILTHRNTVAGIDGFHHIVPRLPYRVVSLLPLSHLFELSIGLCFLLDMGAEILYVRSRNPRVIFEAIRDHRMTGMITVPQVLELFWGALEREVASRGQQARFARARRIARRLPMGIRRRLFRKVHVQFGGCLRLFVSAGAFLPPTVQQGWEDLGVVVMQGYGATETGSGACTTWQDHPLGCVGWPAPGMEMRIADDGEVQFRGPSVTRGYWDDPEATAAAFTEDGWYKSGDLGSFDAKGRLVLHGRKKDMIVLPSGLNVFPEDIENALRIAGIRDSVALETSPGRIEAVILAPATLERIPSDGAASPAELFQPGAELDRVRDEISAAVKAANATMPVHARVDAWRFWPDADFPRTHLLKVKRNEVRAWAEVAGPMPVRDTS